MKRTSPLALGVAFAMLLAACGSDDAETSADTATDAAAATSEEVADDGDAMDDGAMEDGAMEDDAMEDDAMEDDAMEDDAMEDDAMEDDAMEDDAMEDDAMEDDAMEDDAMEEMSEHLGDLSIVGINFDTSEVTIANHTDADISIDGYFLCNFPDYAKVAEGGTVPAGGVLTVASSVAISAVDGELGLYSAAEFDSADAVAAYVQWGSDGHERSGVAVEAGVYDGTVSTVDGSILTAG